MGCCSSLVLWPWLERRATRDYSFHNLLDRPRDAPWRTAFGAALLTWVFVVFLAGSADRVYVTFGIPYSSQIWAYRVLIWVLPFVALALTHRVCVELQKGEQLKLRQRAVAATSPSAQRW